METPIGVLDWLGKLSNHDKYKVILLEDDQKFQLVCILNIKDFWKVHGNVKRSMKINWTRGFENKDINQKRSEIKMLFTTHRVVVLLLYYHVGMFSRDQETC